MCTGMDGPKESAPWQVRDRALATVLPKSKNNRANPGNSFLFNLIFTVISSKSDNETFRTQQIHQESLTISGANHDGPAPLSMDKIYRSRQNPKLLIVKRIFRLFVTADCIAKRSAPVKLCAPGRLAANSQAI